MRGRFCTFEGIDGSGKSTVIQAVAERLRGDGRDVWVTQEETDTWRGEAVRTSIQEHMAPMTTAMLFVADRHAHAPDIRDRLAAGTTVLCDRFTDSTYAYQSVTMADHDDVHAFLDALHEGQPLVPDRTVLLDLEPAQALARARQRGETAPYEKAAFLTEVRAAYLALARAEPGRFRVVDASKQPDEVAAAVVEALDDLF